MKVVLDTNVLMSGIFIACALAAKTRIIVSGDRHLLAVSGFAGIQILRPKPFVDRFL